MSILERIARPSDVKLLTRPELSQLADDLRAEMIAATSLNGGHLAPSLGAVEIILAAYRTLDLPKDKLLFDVGHQAYAHKLLTGRQGGFAKLRQRGGVSGFTRREESPFDVHDAGHASDSLATALGLAIGRDLDGSDARIMAIIGDASIAGGLSMEALNYIGQTHPGRFVIVLNDNEMSISRSVGAISSYLASIRTNQRYRTVRDSVEEALTSAGPIGAGLMRLGNLAKASTKQLLVPGMLFEEMGVSYLGPIDGHDIDGMQETMERAFEMGEPVIIHAVTRKGKGYEPAERNPELFHGVGPFDLATGELVKKPASAPSYTQAFSQALLAEARADGRIVAITAAMMGGTGLSSFKKEFPRRCFDVGIAEECAVTMASGLAIEGKRPVVAIYSTFLQRAFDEISTNVCLPNLPVTFAVDRAGLVGQDGSTHHGAFDLAYLRQLPNMRVAAPSDEAELAGALHAALACEGPVAVRYPRGSARGAQMPQAGECEALPFEGRVLREGSRVCVLAVGKMVWAACDAADELAARGVSCRVVDMRWVKPVDVAAVRRACDCSLVVTIEDGVLAGGFGSAVLEVMADEGLSAPVLRLGLPDAYVGHGSVDELYAELGLDAAGVARSIEARLGMPDGLAAGPGDDASGAGDARGEAPAPASA